jgi:hypothetical protein
VRHTDPMTISRPNAAQQARALTRDELELSIHMVCSAFSEKWFPGVESLNDAREMIDVLAREKHRRDVLDTIAQTEVPFARLRPTPRSSGAVQKPAIPRDAVNGA